MKPHLTVLWALAAMVGLSPVAGPMLQAQGGESAVQAYYRGVADYFGLPPAEIMILSEWRITPEEVPVVLYLSRQGGVSSDALVALKRGGRGWAEIASRYSVGSDAFYVRVEGDVIPGLQRAYQAFRTAASPASVTLTDAELVQLVNLKVLSQHLSASPAQVLGAVRSTGSFVAAYQSLVRGR